MKEHESGHVIDMGSQKSSERLKISLLVSINSIDCELEAVMCKEEVRFERLEHQNTTLSSDEINQRSAPNPLLLESPSGRHSTQKQPSDAREKSSALSNAVHSKTVTRSEAKIGLQSADHFSYSNSLEVSPVEVDHLQIGGGQGDKVRTASYNILFQQQSLCAQTDMLGDQNDNLRQEKSLEQKHRMDRLDVDGFTDHAQLNNKSLNVVDQRQFEAHGIEQDLRINISNGNRDISQGLAPDSAGLSHTSDSEDDIEKDEEDVQKLLTEINNEAILDLKNEETETALDSLKRGEQMLEFITSEGREVDRNLIIVILYNQACCYQRLNMLPDCASYLDGTIYNLEQKVTNFEDDEEFLNMVAQTAQNEMLLGNPMLDPLGNNSISAVSNNLSQGGWDRGVLQLSPEEQLKKFNISSKMFKLRYLCKYHLQLCAVLSQLLRNKEALQHGMMASFYCQELIRNTYFLCHGYINKLQRERSEKRAAAQHKATSAQEKQTEANVGSAIANQNSDEDEPIIIGKQATYYVEENERFLNLLISNCEPILRQLVNKFDQFNKINRIEKAFEQQQGASGGLYGDDSDLELEDILGPIIEEFSIKQDVNLQKETTDAPASGKSTTKNSKKGGVSQKQEFASYTNLKNNYLGRISSPQPTEEVERRSMRDEQTPEQMFERKMSHSNQNAYYNVNKGEDQMTLQKSEKGHVKLQDNVKTILGVKDQDDWIFNLNIGNVMHLLPMSLEELNLHVDNSHELSRDAMLEKIILLSVSYFCVGTELRFLSKQFSAGKGPKSEQGSGLEDLEAVNEARKYQLEDSEMWHAMALETCGTFLPSECPLVSHMIMSFQKHHSPAMTTIPEDQVLNEEIKVLRPLNEVKMDQINYHQIIRSFLTSELGKKPDQQADKAKSGKGDQSGRGMPGYSLSKQGGKVAGNKGPSSLLRGAGAGPSQKKSNRPASKAGLESRSPKKRGQQEDSNFDADNEQFYSLDELAEILCLHPHETESSSRAQQQQQIVSYKTSVQKESKLLSTESNLEVGAAANESIQKPSAWSVRPLQVLSPGTPQNLQSSSIKQANRKSMPAFVEQVQPSASQQKKSLQNLLVKLTEVQSTTPVKQQSLIALKPQQPNIPAQVSQSHLIAASQRKHHETSNEDVIHLEQTPQQVVHMGALAAPPTTIASLAEENQILLKYLQKKQLKKQKDLKEKKSSETAKGQKPNTAQAVLNLAKDSEFLTELAKQAPRPQSKKINRVSSNQDKALIRLQKSPNQIVFNPASQISAGDNSDIPEGQTMSSKKLVRKVKKGNAQGISKSDINAFALASAANHLSLTATATAISKTGANQLKTNITLQQPPSGFGSSQAMGVTSSRVLSGNSQSAGGTSMKSQTLKTFSTTQSLSKTGLNNIRLKQLVQLQTKVIQGISTQSQQVPKSSQGVRLQSATSQPLIAKVSQKHTSVKQFV